MAKRNFSIRTPRGVVYHDKNMKAVLEWNSGFGKKWQEKFANAQETMDYEVYSRCAPYTPHLTGMLIKSGELGTEIGSGTVSWIAPYARSQYYMKRKNTSAEPLRGPYWFERMKSAEGNQILERVSRKFKVEKQRKLRN